MEKKFWNRDFSTANFGKLEKNGKGGDIQIITKKIIQFKIFNNIILTSFFC